MIVARLRFGRTRRVAISVLTWLGLLLSSMEVYGQDKWFITPNRGGVEGARAQAQLTALTHATGSHQASITVAEACGNAGRLHGPAHPATDADGCVAGFQVHEDMVRIEAGHVVSGHPNGAIVLNSAPGDDGNIHFRHLVSADSVSGYSELMTILANGQVGIGTVTPGAKLDVSGAIKVGASPEPCDAQREGAIRYNGSSKVIEFCNGTAWGEIGKPSPSWPIGIVCYVNDGYTGETVFWLTHTAHLQAGVMLYRAIANHYHADASPAQDWQFYFNPTSGAYVGRGSLGAGATTNCDGKSLSQIAADGRAIYPGGATAILAP